MRPIRIAIVFEYLTLLGGERSMLACIDWMTHHEPNFEFVGIVACKQSSVDARLTAALKDRAIEVIHWGSAETGEMRPNPQESTHDFLLAVIESRADLVHANSLAMGRLTGRAAHLLPVPTTTHLRDIVRLSNAARDDLNQNRRLIAVSNETRRFHIEQRLVADRVVVIRNGLDLDRFRPRQPTGRLHNELNLPQSARLIVTIGQIGLRKGQDILAAAAPVISRAAPDVHFIMIGTRTSKKAESLAFDRTIDESFSTNGLGNKFHRLGYRDDVEELLPECHILVHPANQEPYGRVLLEASACGIPIVATNVGGTSEIVIDGETGRLVAPRNSTELARSVVDLLADDKTLQGMRLAARERATRLFDVATSARQLADCWRDVLNKHSSVRVE